jgi:hypothetical protein
MDSNAKRVVSLGELWKVKKAQILLIVLCGFVLIGLMTVYLPQGVDWHLAFRPAAQNLLAGRSPYEVDGFFNAPWALLPLLPIAVLPENLGRAILFLVGMLAYSIVAYRLGATKLTLLVFLLSPPVMHGLLNANIDWFAMLGFILPPQIGLFFLVIKPQIGIGVAAYWLVDIWRQKGFRQVVLVFSPVTIAALVSFQLFGIWPLRFGKEIDLWWNASLWPASIPVGIALLAAAIRKRKMEYAMGAGPCLSPYILLHSWAGALVAIVSLQAESLAATVGLWILVLMRAFG